MYNIDMYNIVMYNIVLQSNKIQLNLQMCTTMGGNGLGNIPISLAKSFLKVCWVWKKENSFCEIQSENESDWTFFVVDFKNFIFSKFSFFCTKKIYSKKIS